MSPLSHQDDYIHAIGKDPTWREAFYFDFYDPATGLCAFGYSGVHPNQEIGDVIFALWRGEVLLSSFTRWDFNIPADIGEERYGFGPLFFRPVDPFKTWEMYFDDGSCQVDLTFHAIHPPYNWADAHAALSATNSHHYEQQGHYSGRVKIGGERFAVQGIGVRDHAWGWGARAGIQRWVWASAQFSEHFAWNTFQVTLAEGRDILYGYVFRGGENQLLRSSRIRADYAVKGRSPLKLDLQLAAGDSDNVTARGQILNSFNTSFQERNKTGYHFFCFTRYECEGQVGYGQSNFHWRSDADRPLEWAVQIE